MVHYVAAQLRVRLSALEGALHDAREAPGGEEVLHHVRVAARRYLQAIRLFADFLDGKRVKYMRRRLGRLMERCGAVRDYDVALGVLAGAGCEDAALRKKLALLRTAQQAKLSTHLHRWRGGRSLKHWSRFLVPARLPSMTVAHYAQVTLPSMLDNLFASGALAVAAGNEGDLHRFRLLAKRFRYSLELFEDVYGPEARKCLRALGALQDRLGAIHDCTASLSLVRGSADAEASVRALVETRRHEFIHYWTRFQKRHAAWKRWLEGGRPHASLSTAPRRGRAA